MHPSEVLFQGQRPPISLPACDHYAGSEELMRKSAAMYQEQGPVFDITFDREDGVAAGNEEAHARLVGKMIACGDNYFDRTGVRVHDVHHPAFEPDVQIVCELAAARLAYVTLPKVGNTVELERAIVIVNRHAHAAGRTDLPIHVLIETQCALIDAFAIAALPQVQCLSFGIMDFVSSHYGAILAVAIRSPGQFTHPLVVRAKLEIAAACHAYGKVASRNVTTKIKDTAMVANDATRAGSGIGYTRMWSIHPDQIKPILKSFAPRMSEINEASTILADVHAQQWGPIQHDGKLHDRASYSDYRTMLQRARANGTPVPDFAASLF